MIGLNHDEARKILDQRGLSRSLLRTSFSGFLREAVAERGWAEALSDLAHEADDGVCDGGGISLTDMKRIDVLFESGARVSFPKIDLPVKKAAKRLRRLVVAGQYQ